MAKAEFTASLKLNSVIQIFLKRFGCYHGAGIVATQNRFTYVYMYMYLCIYLPKDFFKMHHPFFVCLYVKSFTKFIYHIPYTYVLVYILVYIAVTNTAGK